MKTLKLLLSSLVSNDKCVEGGRQKPWYFAILFFLFSVVLSVLPLTISTAVSNGSSFVSSTRYAYQNGLTRFNEELDEKGLDLIVTYDEGAKLNSLVVSKNGVSGKEVWNETFVSNKAYRFEHYGTGDVLDFEVYYTDTYGEAFINYYSNVIKLINPLTNENFDSTSVSGSTATGRDVSFIVFGKFEFVTSLYKSGNTSVVGSLSGDYANTQVGTNLKDFAKTTVDGVIYSPTSTGLDHDKYLDYTWSNWMKFYDQSYINSRAYQTWSISGIMLAINAALTLMMGLLVFILTRGKNNPFRIYTFWESQKIAYWASLSPAVIAMIVGFISSTYGMMAFIMLMGIRIMWMSMKTLRPQQ